MASKLSSYNILIPLYQLNKNYTKKNKRLYISRPITQTLHKLEYVPV